MKHINIPLILSAVLMLTACSDNTSSISSETTVPYVESTPSQIESSHTEPTEQSSLPEETGGVSGGISITNGYNELQSLCTLINENDVYADFESAGLEYYSCTMPDFSEYYSFPDEIPEQVLYDMEHGAYPEMTPAQYYVRKVSPFLFNNCNMYCMVSASDETGENKIYDVWEMPVSTGEPTKLFRVGVYPLPDNYDPYYSNFSASLKGVNNKYILYSTRNISDNDSRTYIYNRKTNEITELPVNSIDSFLMNDMVFVNAYYTVTVLKSEYSLPIIYKYNIPSGAMDVYQFNASLLSSANSGMLVFESDGQTYAENAWFGGWRYTPEENERYFYDSGSSVGITIPTDESEIFGYKYIIGRQLNSDEKQLFVKTSYNVYPWYVSFSEGHFMGSVLDSRNDDTYYSALYDKRGGRLMLVDPAEGLNNVCSDGRWMYYYNFDKVVAVLCE